MKIIRKTPLKNMEKTQRALEKIIQPVKERAKQRWNSNMERLEVWLKSERNANNAAMFDPLLYFLRNAREGSWNEAVIAALRHGIRPADFAWDFLPPVENPELRHEACRLAWKIGSDLCEWHGIVFDIGVEFLKQPDEIERGQEIGAFLERLVGTLFLEREDELKAVEHHTHLTKGTQKLGGAWIVNAGGATGKDVTEFFKEHLADIGHQAVLKGALVLYNVYPEKQEGFGMTPAELGHAVTEFLSIPDTAPRMVFAHMADNLVHAHILFSRHVPGEKWLLKEGTGWSLNSVREFLDGKVIKAYGEEALKEKFRNFPHTEWCDVPERAREQGLFAVDDTNGNRVRYVSWGASVILKRDQEEAPCYGQLS